MRGIEKATFNQNLISLSKQSSNLPKKIVTAWQQIWHPVSKTLQLCKLGLVDMLLITIHLHPRDFKLLHVFHQAQ